MPGQVPIRNGKFSNAPDFNNQGVTGITGLGVFRQFTPISYNGTDLVITSNHLWSIITCSGSGNVLVHVDTPASLGANIGDEILIFSLNGTVTVSGSAVLSNHWTSYPKRTIKLVSISSTQWILTGFRTNYTATTVTNCCGVSVPSFYNFEGDYEQPAWVTNYGQSLYNSSNYDLSGVLYIPALDRDVSIMSGSISEADCADTLRTWNVGYTIYDSASISYTVYSPYNSATSTIVDPSLLGTPFKTEIHDGYLCDTSMAVQGTYYAFYDPVYGLSNPICFNSNGVLTSQSSGCV